MFLRHDVSRLWFELTANFAAPRAVFKDLAFQASLLDWCDVFPGFVIAGTVTMMHGVEDAEPCVAASIQDSQHIWNAVVGFCNGLNVVPDLAAFGNEVVVRIDDNHSGDVLFILGAHVGSSFPLCSAAM